MPTNQNNIDVRLSVSGVAAVTSAVNRVGNVFGGLATRLAGAASGAASALLSVQTIERIVQAVGKAIDTADQMGKLAEKTGIAVEALSKLSHAAKINDVEQGTLQAALKNLSEEMVKVGRGAVPLEEELLRIADQFAAMPDGAGKAQRAVELFGRSGLDMIPLLNQGSKGIRQLMDEARGLGVVVGPDFARNADEFNDNVTRMHAAVRGFWLTIANQLLPDLIRITDEIIRLNKETNNLQTAAINTATSMRVLLNYFNEGLESPGEFAKRLLIPGYALKRLKDAAENLVARDIAGEIERQFKGIIASLTPKATPHDFLTVEQVKKQVDERRKLIDLSIKEAELRLEIARADIQLDPSERLAKEKRFLAEINALLEQKRRLSSTAHFEGKPPLPKEDLRRFEVEDQGALLRIEQQQRALDQESFMGRSHANFKTLFEQWGNIGKGMADVFTSSIQRAVEGVTAAIMGLIDGTTTWGQVFAQVAKQVIASIIQVVLQWIVSMTILKALKKLFHTEDNIAAAQSAAAWTPAAIAASIASYGAAAAAGSTAFAVAMAAGTALTAGLSSAAGSFAEGGYTGPGGRYQPAGIVHRGEFVFPAPSVQRIGLDNLEAINAGATPTAAPNVNVAPQFKLAVVNTRQEMKRFLESGDGRAIILDTLRQTVKGGDFID